MTAALANLRATLAIRSFALPHALPRGRVPTPSLLVRCAASNDSHDDPPQPSSSAPNPDFRGFGQPPFKPMSTADALREGLSTASNAVGRVARATNVVLGTDESEEKWRELDQQVNEYPGQRTFKAIGSGGEDFVASMTAAVAAQVGTVHAECVSRRAKGKWVSVTVGPVWVETPEQVLAIYEAMKDDGRLKFFI
jgi:putative lipoic acid-binding regulatory protein